VDGYIFAGWRLHLESAPWTICRPPSNGEICTANGWRAYGFSPQDKARIRQLAEDLTDTYSPAALDDLSVPIRVGAVEAAWRTRFGGETLGVLSNAAGLKVALVFWRLTVRERDAWARRRAGR
jgi:hypothetical protein